MKDLLPMHKEILKLKRELYMLISSGRCITDSSVIQKSAELDMLVYNLMKKQIYGNINA